MSPPRRICTLAAVLVLGAAACGDDAPAPDRSVEQPGPYAAATARYTAMDAARGRLLEIQAWYPTEAAAAEVGIETLEDAPQRARYAGLLASAPACATRRTTVAVDALPTPGPFPVVLFSHCHTCTRLGNATTAARLATHGFVVYAVDHAGNTLWDHLDGAGGELDTATLELRAADVRFVLDEVAAGTAPASDVVNLTRVGVFGHSFGAVTAGRVAQLDDRVAAAAALCAPMENPLITGVTLAEVAQPLLFVVAQEDNSITELGNVLMRTNFRDAPGAAWKLEVPDAGHWTVSDLDGLVDIFAAGCNNGIRQTDGTPFTYLDPAAGRELTAAAITAFFRATLDDDAGARAYLGVDRMAGVPVEADAKR